MTPIADIEPTWALTIATYNRASVLPTALRLAAGQSRPPAEIIIVDASADWARTRDLVMGELAPDFPHIAFCYLEAEAKGAGAQRNQAVSAATADIVFVFDDDTLMYPDCAEEIMRIYGADTGQQMVGVQATISPAVPPGCESFLREHGLDAVDRARHRPPPPAGGGILRQGKSIAARFVHRHILLRDIDLRFVPYASQSYPGHDLPMSVQSMDVSAIRLMVGFKMTLRRKIAEQVRFDASVRSASIEDLDVSYRASFFGPLVNANKAIVHHVWSETGRDSRRRRQTISLAHLAMCIRRHAPDLNRARSKYYVHWARSCIAAIFTDAIDRDWRFPTLFGSIGALGPARRVLGADDTILDDEIKAIAGELSGRA